ncbi:MAG: hypothetical protein AMXMBFR7_23910 [Planctomycetota bacterium]
MLFKLPILEAIAAGRVRLAFRRWTKARVKAGSTLRTPVGVLVVASIETCTEVSIGAAEARAAGYASKAELLKDLNAFGPGCVYRIELRFQGSDPRIALRRRSRLSAAARAEIARKLERLDNASRWGPWTNRVLALIRDHPGLRATELAAKAGREAHLFKTDVRKLKELGLTESLQPGYRLSPRGRAWMHEVRPV